MKTKNHIVVITACALAPFASFAPFAVAAPYNQAIIDAGVQVWQNQLDTRGRACADCHGAPDGFDLAIFNFTDADIRRRGTPNHVGTVDTEKVVALVQELRKKFDITSPMDPRTVRPFQPGGTPLAGVTATERDAAFMQTLQTKLPTLANGTIDSATKAETAITELLAFDMRSERIGINFPLWSADILFGVQHGTIYDWVADEGYIPVDAAARATINAARATYMANPTEANFWAMYTAIEANAEVRDTVTSANQRNLWEMKYLSALIASHDLLMEKLGQPRISDKANARHRQINSASNTSVFPTWEFGDVFNTVGTFSDEILAGLDPNINEAEQAALCKIGLWWLGFQYNNAVSHEAQRQEYFPNTLLLDNPIHYVPHGDGFFTSHGQFYKIKSDMSLFRLPNPISGAAPKYGNVTALPVAPFSTAPQIGNSLPFNPDTDTARWFNATHKAQTIKFSVNAAKAKLYAIKKQLEDNIAAGVTLPEFQFTGVERGDINDLLCTKTQLAVWDAANTTHNNNLISQIEALRVQAKRGSTIPVTRGGNGLNGAYFNSSNFTNLLFNRVDPRVHFANAAKIFGGADGAIQSTASGNLSVRWTGYFVPRYNDTYKFWMFMAGDDREVPITYGSPYQGNARVWVNGVLVFDMWTDNKGLQPNPSIFEPTIVLQAGRPYTITVDFRQAGPYQRVSLWQWSANKQPWEVIPQEQLFSTLPPETVPAAPDNLVLTKPTTNSVNATWTDYSYNETGFVVQRKTGAGGVYADVGSVGANATSLLNGGLATSATYYYRVRAINSHGNSTYSSEVAVSTGTGPVTTNLVVYEGFDYPVGTTLVGKGAGKGWLSNSTWTTNGTAIVGPVLSFSDYPTFGYSGRVSTADRHMRRQVAAAMGGGATVWSSFLFRDAGINDYNDGDYLRFLDGSSFKLNSAPARKGGNNSGTAVDSTYGTTGVKLANGNTYLIITKFTNVGSGSSGTPQTATMWALSAAQYDAVKAGGVSEAELDANNTVRCTDSFTAAKSIAAGNTLEFVNTRTGNGYVDEIKLATSLAPLFEAQ